jgi:hypothetical protein
MKIATTRTAKVLLLAALLAGIGAVSAERRAEAVSIPDLKLTQFGVESGLLTVIFSKELCSCHFVDGLTIDQCKATSNLPSGADKIIDLQVDEQNKTIAASYNLLARAISPLHTGPAAAAAFDQEHPEFGCVLTAGP